MNAPQPTVARLHGLLLATDRSEFSVGAERIAIALAQKCGAKLAAMTMVISNAELEALAPQRMLEEESVARAYLDGLATRAGAAAVPCETLICRGQEPHREILAAAASMSPGMIVMGRRGRRGLARLMVGDATARVVGSAPCPVLVVPRAAQMWRSRIVLATDGSRFSDIATALAAEIAVRCSLPVTVVSVVRESFNEARAKQADEAIARARAELAAAGAIADAEVTRGQSDERIVAVAAERGADLIVLGSHGRTGWQRVLLGSVAERVIGAAACAVLVARA
jgi:nucleotide-binding universal stress UspA family protein